jgi:dihydroorotate dehydrogenase electron transfer subunit
MATTNPADPAEVPPPVVPRGPVHDTTAHVVDLRRLGGGYYIGRFQPREPVMGLAAPGMFVMIGTQDHELRRPFSLFDVTPASGSAPQTFDVLFKVVGSGSASLAALREGISVDLLGPLGTGFPLPQPNRPIICVGGGFGLAPFHFGLMRWGGSGGAGRANLPPITLCAGARTAAELPFVGDLECSVAGVPGAGLRVTTDDGSLGDKGLVTDAVERRLDELAAAGGGLEPPVLYACGPHGMMAAVTRIAESRGLDAWLSLEENMACGYGVCNGCVVPRRTPDEAAAQKNYIRICVDGPVVHAGSVALA